MIKTPFLYKYLNRISMTLNLLCFILSYSVEAADKDKLAPLSALTLQTKFMHEISYSKADTPYGKKKLDHINLMKQKAVEGPLNPAAQNAYYQLFINLPQDTWEEWLQNALPPQQLSLIVRNSPEGKQVLTDMFNLHLRIIKKIQDAYKIEIQLTKLAEEEETIKAIGRIAALNGSPIETGKMLLENLRSTQARSHILKKELLENNNDSFANLNEWKKISDKIEIFKLSDKR